MWRKPAPTACTVPLHAHQALPLPDGVDLCEFCGQLHSFACPRIRHARYEMVLSEAGSYERRLMEVWFFPDVSHELWHVVAEVAEPEA